MSITVQSSFEQTQCDITKSNIKIMLNSGDAIYNNFIYGVNQNTNSFNASMANVCLRNNYSADMLNDLLCHLNNAQPVCNLNTPQQENVFINNTTIEEDQWDSIEW